MIGCLIEVDCDVRHEHKEQRTIGRWILMRLICASLHSTTSNGAFKC